MIQTTFSQEKSPLKILRDSRGKSIEVGLRIAYNRSGDIAIGKIVGVKKNEWKTIRPGSGNSSWWNLKFEMLVEHEDGTMSTIKNPNSFVII